MHVDFALDGLLGRESFESYGTSQAARLSFGMERALIDSGAVDTHECGCCMIARPLSFRILRIKETP